MMRNLLFLPLMLLALTSCEQIAKPASKPAPPVEPVAVSASATPVPVPTAAEMEAAYKSIWAAPQATDTALTLDGHRYRLQLRSEMDSTRLLRVTVKNADGPEEHAKGYEAYFTFTLRDSTGQAVFRRQLRKADFYKRIEELVVVSSEAGVPQLLGYSRPLRALVFALGFVVDGTEWGSDVLLLMDLKGRVLRMADGVDYGGGPRCDIALAPDGRTLLTHNEIIRAGQPDLPLDRPGAELRAAFLLSDTTALTLHAPGSWHKMPVGDHYEEQFIVSAAQRKMPNAFVLDTRSGRVLTRFRFDGVYEELGYAVAYHYLPATRRHYLLDLAKGLCVLPTAAPANPVIPFAALPKFTPPQRPSEVQMELQGLAESYIFYVDTLAPRRIRYQDVTVR